MWSRILNEICISIALVLLLGGCALFEKKSDYAKIEYAGQHTSLEWIPANNPQQASIAYYSALNADVLNTDEANNILAECSIPKEKARAGIIDDVISAAIRLFINGIDDVIKKELQTYATEYKSIATSESFYMPNAAGKPWPRFTSPCFRIVHFPVDENGNRKNQPTLDFIGKFKASDDPQYVELVPLRLYFREPSYPKKDIEGKVGIAITMQIEIWWRDINTGKTSVSPVIPILDESIDYQKGKATVRYYRENKPLLKNILPLPPRNTDGKRAADQGTFVVVSATVAEAGPAPELLRKLDKFLEDNKEKLQDTLVKAVEKQATGSAN